MGEDPNESADDLNYRAALERAARDASHHPAPQTPGLLITEGDHPTMVLYEDVCRHQLTWDYLLQMDEALLYWLAGHDERPPGLADDEWTKLRQNAWRARAAAERRADDRAAARTAEEHRNNRAVQVWAVVFSGFTALTVTLLTNFLAR